MKQTDLGADLYNGAITGGVAASLTAAQAIKNASGPSVLTTCLEQPSRGGLLLKETERDLPIKGTDGATMV